MAPLQTLWASVLQATVILLSSIPPAFPLDSTTLHNDLQNLLCLKVHLSDSAGLLASWKNDSHQFCSWAGVSCGKRHSFRVVALNLESFELNGQIPACIANLTFLARIHFPNNQLSGPIPREIGQLNRLQYLNLTSNDLSGLIPDTLSSCSRLKIIDLGRNFLQGEIPQNLSQCLNLEKLILQHNLLSGGIPEGLGMLDNFSILHLAGNSLTGNIPVSLGSKSSLRSIVLTNNSLTGPIPFLLANSSSLQVLDLTNNHLGGEIPYALLSSRSLKTVALGLNNFVGSIPDVLTHTDSPLEYLILSSNNLSGDIPSSLGNLSSLYRLLLAYNNLQGSIPMSISKIPNLLVLDLTYNLLSGTVPTSLYNMSALTYLGMATNSLVGEIPHDIGYTLPSMKALILQGNQFHGQIPTSLANATNLTSIILQDNAFHGTVPSLGSLSNLVELNLGMNQLEAGDWSFLSTLANCTQLVKLYLFDNNIQGALPSSIGSLPNSLEVLLLAGNKIYGSIPPEIGYLRNLRALYMENNLITGSIPDTIGELSRLFALSLSRNRLSGQIPFSMGKLSQLSELYLQENRLSGEIPGVLGQCKTLDNLNLSCNNFHGSIPKDLFEVSTLSEGFDLSHNHLSGPIPLEIGNLINLGTLNFSNNQLSGPVPSTLAQCVHLESLHMEGNLLEGRIPESFKELRGIIELDLSQNNLSGEIPELFESFGSLSLLNLSFNNLEGPVPTGGVFDNISEVFIMGNKKLCGRTPLLNLPLCNEKASRQKHTSKILKILGFGAISLVALSCLVISLLKKRKKIKQQAHPSCKELKRFTYADLIKATNGFSLANLVGSGKYGSVYTGVLESEEHAVAIKVFKLDQLGAPKSFLTECEALRNIRHRNLLKVISVCSSFDPAGNEFKALVLEYMANGSLDRWLHPNLNNNCLHYPLSLGSRIIIAMDIASSIDYLHNHCVPPVVHCDLKPSNVLLDNEMGARVCDFGLAKFVHSSSSINSSTSLQGPRGSIGYIAPEYGFGSIISREGDVYSYGIIILELLTGKRPTDEMFRDGWSLHKFVEKEFPQNISEILDPSVLPKFGEDVDNNSDCENPATLGMMNCIKRLVKLGLSCSHETPKYRPTMQDAYAEVTAIKEEFSTLRG